MTPTLGGLRYHTDHAGIAYFWTRADAETVRGKILDEYPEARLVYYTRGWTIQIARSGDYIGRTGRPTLEGMTR